MKAMKNIFVGDLSFDATEDVVRSMFETAVEFRGNGGQRRQRW
jgi:hypothetical protein